MLVLSIILAYIVIGVVNGIRTELWWWEVVFKEYWDNDSIDSYCSRHKIGKQKHDNSAICAIFVSGLCWPIFPIFKAAILVRKLQKERLEARLEREAEVKAEREALEKEEAARKAAIVTPPPK